MRRQPKRKRAGAKNLSLFLLGLITINNMFTTYLQSISVVVYFYHIKIKDSVLCVKFDGGTLATLLVLFYADLKVRKVIQLCLLQEML